MNMPIDLDANATTAPLPEVIETITRCLRDVPGNPGSRHALGRKARQVLETSRESIAAILGADADEVLFTGGGTEANNLAVVGLIRGPARTIVVSPAEHPSNLETCRALIPRGWSLDEMPIDARGCLIESQLTTRDWTHVGLATTILSHNETGVIQDVGRLAALCREHRVPWHIDAVQSVGKIPVHFHDLGATTLSLGAHKFHGPRGVGALLVRRGTPLSPLIFGGHQEQERRPGTESVALIAGMATALELWQRDQAVRTRKLAALRDRLQTVLSDSVPPVVVHGASASRLPNTLNIAFPGLDGEALLVGLDLAGVCCSLGSTCASGSMEAAPILLAMGVPPEIAKASVRFSVSVQNTQEEIDDAAQRIRGVVTRLRAGQ